MEILYLHGFASSAQSSKAAFFAEKLRRHGLTLRTPDFNQPDFRSLTITRMLGDVERALDAAGPGPVALIGSSLGGAVAVHAAVRRPGQITHLVLLAPAVDLRPARLAELGDRTLAEYEAAGETLVFHYGYGRMMSLGYGLYEDARQYDTLRASFAQPAIAFQGRRDTSVLPESVERWAATRPNVELRLLDDDHQLHASLDAIWAGTAAFLGIEDR